MGHFNKQDYFFGAALSCLLNNNEDSIPSLIEPWEMTGNSAGYYQLTTNTSPGFRILMKCRKPIKPDAKKRTKTTEWQFNFSDVEHGHIQDSINDDIPIFIFLICSQEDFSETRVAVVKSEEYRYLTSDKPVIKVEWKPGWKNFTLSDQGTRQNYGSKKCSIPCNRITKKLTEINDSV